MSTSATNAQVIAADLQWLQTIIERRINNFINQNYPEQVVKIDTPAPDISAAGVFYADFVRCHELTTEERQIVLLALAPEVQPELLDQFLIRNSLYDKTFTEFGGLATGCFNGFIPTFKTALFLLGGEEVSEQLRYSGLFEKTGKLFEHGILRDFRDGENNPVFHQCLALSGSALSYILKGEDVRYEYSSDFPARQLTTLMEWEDLVLQETTLANLKELLVWPSYGKAMIEQLRMAKNIQPGYRALFYGPSGTGKTLTVALIGKKVGKPVYRIDLSQLVSKYIGETEKNLEKIFTVAANKDWILFFDEADALFGKRTGIGTSNDRFANQETAYLLQRIEVCENIVILATNLKANLDEAFTRRFQSIVYFALPQEGERLQLWQGAFSGQVTLEKAIDLAVIAKKYDIAGGSIVSVVRYATLMAVAKGTRQITYTDLMDGLRREYAKLGRTL
ncbi:MAG: ATP-binding protein [Bacillota bacterium]|jgi:hypothetical protein